MKPRIWLILVIGLAAVSLSLVVMGCGGASLNTGKNRNLEQVEPDFVEPVWYEDYQNDKRAAYERYDGKVLQIGVRVADTEESTYGTEVTGTTGDEDRFRASCTFPAAAASSLENVRAGSYIEVKGLFDHMQETANTYQIYLRNCVLVR